MDFIKNVFKDKTIYRILFQWCIRRNNKYIKGKILDLGSGSNPSYYEYLGVSNKEYYKTDLLKIDKVDYVVDFTKKLPFDDSYFDTVCIFNALYIAPNPSTVLSEVFRVLSPGGCCIVSMPFVSNEMPEPDDYHRYTLQGLDLVFLENNFTPIFKERFGERFTACVYILNPFFRFRIVKFFIYGLAIFLDKLIPKKLKNNYPMPLGYFYVGQK